MTLSGSIRRLCCGEGPCIVTREDGPQRCVDVGLCAFREALGYFVGLGTEPVIMPVLLVMAVYLYWLERIPVFKCF